MLESVQKLIDIAIAEVGYLEKASVSNLDDKTANAGSADITKYSRDMDAIDGFYNTKKQGADWCDIFVDWCFVQAFGVTDALTLLCQPWGSAGAGVGYSANYYKAKGQYHTSNPQPGDQIFFGTTHTGLVYAVDDTYVYTVEGNVSNGVRQKSYLLTSSSIAGYGRPDWDIVEVDFEPYSENRYLTLEEMQLNARYIYAYLYPRGWTLNAIAGMLGNFETESTINPGIWQNLVSGNTSAGFGLVQWTPATKYFDWCTANGLVYYEMDTALQRIEWELANGEQYYPTEAYPETFAEFKKSKATPYYLGMAFLINYERPKDQDQPARGEQAEYWYKYLSGQDVPSGGGGGGVTPAAGQKRKYNFVLFGRHRRSNFI